MIVTVSNHKFERVPVELDGLQECPPDWPITFDVWVRIPQVITGTPGRVMRHHWKTPLQIQEEIEPWIKEFDVEYITTSCPYPRDNSPLLPRDTNADVFVYQTEGSNEGDIVCVAARTDGIEERSYHGIVFLKTFSGPDHCELIVRKLNKLIGAYNISGAREVAGQW